MMLRTVSTVLLLSTVQFFLLAQVNRSLAADRPTSGKARATKVVFIAGRPSHGFGAHEHHAGCLLLARSLHQAMPHIKTVVCRDGWPKDPKTLDGADAVVIFADGGGRHPALAHLDQLDQVARNGAGIVCLHYAVEVPKGEAGEKMLDWIGGYFEPFWSVNPHWTASFDRLPEHPITRGVRPFQIRDEWYYHMRFRAGMKGVTPILTDLPPAETLRRRDGAHSNNPHVRQAVLERHEPQHVAWAAERPGGGRGFGFTGGHFHWNWGHNDFRRLVLNGIVWCAHLDVPEQGVQDEPVTLDDLLANQDYPTPKGFDPDKLRSQFPFLQTK